MKSGIVNAAILVSIITKSFLLTALSLSVASTFGTAVLVTFTLSREILHQSKFYKVGLGGELIER